ncbi:MAG: hypothetical protein LBD46_08915 [Endomicrobium sp.]|jgi:hypothetical protein|nr:hypothetical protein [Endomicrobium sp.]
MKKFIFLFIVTLFFLTACDKEDSNNSYKFKGTVEINQYPSGSNLSLEELAKPQYDSKIRFEAFIKDASGKLVENVSVSWGTKNILSNCIKYSSLNKMVVDVKEADFMPGNIIQVTASYGGVFSSSIMITFRE